MQKNEIISELLPECGMRLVIKDGEWFDFSRLPWVVFLSILKFLKTSELCRSCLVNKLWNKACRDPSLWRYLDLIEYSGISNKDLARFTSFSKNVVVLRLSQCENLTGTGVSHALKQCSSLVECSIFNCRELSDDVLTTLGEFCHFLKRLDITLCLSFSNNGIQKVCEGCPKLEEIVIDQCAYLTNDTLTSLGGHSAVLKYISAANNTFITDEGVLALVQGCSELMTLRFPFCSLTSVGTNHIVEYCTKLVYLDIRGVKLEDNDVHNMVVSLSKLETLNLGLCDNLTDASATEIGMYCKQLKHLFLVRNKVTDEGLFQLSVHCRNLLRLDVSWCQGVTEVGARYILNGCPKLKHLGLFRCDRVSESAVNELNSQFPHVFISTLNTEMKKSFAKKEEPEDIT